MLRWRGGSEIPSKIVRRVGRSAIALALLATTPVAATGPSLDIGTKRGEISKQAYFKPGLAPVRQAGPYDVTIVYFIDYQCPACRKYSPDVARAIDEDRKVRVIYRDTPIFGPRSEEAARVAIASQFQGKHEAMHRALMSSEMPLDEESLEAAAKKAGVDWARLQRDLKARSDDIDLQIAWNMELAQSAGIRGTPAFIIGDTLADGVLDYAGVKGSIADARAANPSARAEPAEPEPKPQSAEPAAAPAPAAKQPGADTSASAPPAAVQFERTTTEPLSGQPPEDSDGRMPWAWIAIIAAALASAGFVLRKRLA